MMSPWAFRALCTIAVLLSSMSIFITGSVLVARANNHCFHFMEPWFVGLGVCISALSLFGLAFLWFGYPRCYVFHVLFIGLLALALVVVLGFFWTLVAASHDRVASRWMRHYMSEDRWSRVSQCMVRGDFCTHYPDFHACCDVPDGCDVPSTAVDIDCILWGDARDTLCYGCHSCRLATVIRLRHDGRWLEPALTIFICFLLVVVVTSVVELYMRGVPL